MNANTTLLTKAILITLATLLYGYEMKEAAAAATKAAATSNTSSTTTTTATKVAAGYGIGRFSCPNGLILNNEQIHFEVINKKGGRLLAAAGGWSIDSSLNLHTKYTILGSIDDIRYSSSALSLHNNIFLKGIDQDNICSKAVGSGSIVKTNYITITGQCNIKGATSISFTAVDGKKGTFNGSIICDVIK